MSLFIRKDFISHAGIELDFKIECDSLTDEDLETLAFIASTKLLFRGVIGIPRGGLRFAEALKKWEIPNPSLPLLIVDDVLTTGKSMNEYKEKYSTEFIMGLVIFSRMTNPPHWITPLFRM